MVKLSLALLSVLLVTALLAGSKEKTFASQLPTDQITQLSPWEKLFEEDPDPPRNQTSGGSRGPVQSKFCPLAPSVDREIMATWSQYPLFLWQGRVERMEVRLHDSDKVLWSIDASRSWQAADSSAIYRAFYEGEALQPGQTYDWVIFDPANIPTYIPFHVMAQSERDAIAAELTQMEAPLKQQGATAETIAVAKAKYFARRRLWSDVLQEAMSVKNPSAALTRFVKKIPARFCKSEVPRIGKNFRLKALPASMPSGF